MSERPKLYLVPPRDPNEPIAVGDWTVSDKPTGQLVPGNDYFPGQPIDPDGYCTGN